MHEPAHPGPQATSQRPGLALEIVLVATALGLGALTAVGQQHLPDALRSAANSSGSWCLIAVLTTWSAPGPVRAAVRGAVSLWALLVGYVLFNAAAGASSASSTVLFWTVTAFVAGPVLGMSAFLARRGRRQWSVVGAAVIGGVLVGEGVYGLTVIADTTSPVYWWVQIIIGTLLVGVIARVRRWTGRFVVIAVVLTAAAAAAFRFGYATTGTLITLI